MSRWIILSSTFLAWALSMAAVYHSYGPRAPSSDITNTRLSMNDFVGEETTRSISWKIYLNPDKLRPNVPSSSTYYRPRLTHRMKQNLKEKRAIAAYSGSDPGDIEVGFLKIKTTKTGPSRIEQVAQFSLKIPGGISPIASKLGTLRGKNISYITMQEGLESFKSELSLGQGAESVSIGHRSKLHLIINQSSYVLGKKISSQLLKLKIPNGVAPPMTFSPFQDRPSIKDNDSWSITSIGTNGLASEPKWIVRQANVIEKTTILYHGKEIHVFHVQLEGDDHAEAWYNISGKVLKAKWKFQKLFPLPLTIVRASND